MLEVLCAPSPSSAAFDDKTVSLRRRREVASLLATLAGDIERLHGGAATVQRSPLLLHMMVELHSDEDARLGRFSFQRLSHEAAGAESAFLSQPLVRSADTAAHVITVRLGVPLRTTDDGRKAGRRATPVDEEEQLRRFRRFLLDHHCPPISRMREEWKNEQRLQGPSRTHSDTCSTTCFSSL